MKNAKKAPMTVTERGKLDGQRWIQRDGMVDATDAEMLDEAEGGAWLYPEADRQTYVDAFLAGVASLLLVGA